MQVVKDVCRQMLSNRDLRSLLLGLSAQRIVFEKPLDADKHNALRYAAGYVLRSVKMRQKIQQWLHGLINRGCQPMQTQLMDQEITSSSLENGLIK